LNNLEETVVTRSNKLYLLSQDGMFYTQNGQIFRIVTENEDDILTINNYVNHINIVVDNSHEVHKNVHSLPYEHTQFNTLTLTVTLKNNDDVQLVLFGKPKVSSVHPFFKKHTTGTYDCIDIIDFYFTTDITDITNGDLKKSINEFLLALN
jgi:hypothetical protein